MDNFDICQRIYDNMTEPDNIIINQNCLKSIKFGWCEYCLEKICPLDRENEDD